MEATFQLIIVAIVTYFLYYLLLLNCSLSWYANISANLTLLCKHPPNPFLPINQFVYIFSLLMFVHSFQSFLITLVFELPILHSTSQFS